MYFDCMNHMNQLKEYLDSKIWLKEIVYMASEVVDTIILSGEDSINFVNNLFRPSMDSLHSNSQILASLG